MPDLTPKQLVAELDSFIVGQPDAKRAVAVAVRNRWRRRQLSPEVARDVSPKNIIMSGPTGVGKTEIARRLAALVGAPFVKVEATKFTEVGYFGRDVESIVRDLLNVAVALVREEMTERVKSDAERRVEDRLLDALLPEPTSPADDDEARQRRERTRERFRKQLRAGELEESEVEVQLQRKAKIGGLLGAGPGMEMDSGMQGMLEKMMPRQTETKRLKVAQARAALFRQEADKLIDDEKVHATAIERVEQEGVIFLDEIDKVVARGETKGADVSREGVQRDLLPIVEGSTVNTPHGPVKTDHVLFIAAGAFHAASVSDLMPELQGRFPIRVALDDLTRDDFVRILTVPQNALLAQQTRLLATEGLAVTFTDDAVAAMAEAAFEANRRQQNIGARRLYTVVERVLEEVSFDAPERAEKRLEIDAVFVRERLAEVTRDDDLSKFVL